MNYDVSAVVRTNEHFKALEKEYDSYQIDLDADQAISLPVIANTVVFYFVPPPAQGTSDTRIETFLTALSPQDAPRKIVLISTTGVYGNCGEEWVDESRKPRPDTDRARRRLDAENILTHWCQQRDIDYVILRVPGIYGPDKLPLKRLQENKPVLSLSESPWSNRIHIDDLVQACINAMHYTGEYRIFNVSDGHPSSMTDYFLSVAKALNLPTPQQVSLEACKQIFSDNMISYLLESKKINNDRLLNELKVTLKYPDLQHGLSDLASQVAINEKKPKFI